MKSTLILILILFFNFSLHSENKEINDTFRAKESYNKALLLIRSGEFSKAIDSLKISVVYREKLFTKLSVEYGNAQNALGVTYRNLGNLGKALDHLLIAETAYLSNSIDNEAALARLYNNIGNIYKSKLNFNTALDYYNRAIAIYSKNENFNKNDIAEIYYNIAESYYIQNAYYKVLEITEKFFPLAYEDTKMYYLSLKAGSLKELNKVKEAYDTYLEIIRYALTHFSESDIDMAYEYLSFANFLLSISEFEEAKVVLDAAEKILLRVKNKEGKITFLYNKAMGAYYELIKLESNDIEKFQLQKSLNLKKAIDHYHLAFEAVQIEPDGIENFSVENTLSLTNSLTSLKLIADAYAQIFEIYQYTDLPDKKIAVQEALKYYEITSKMIQQARRSMYSDEDKILLAELEEATFYKMIKTAYKAYKMDYNPEVLNFAFTSAEKMKASAVFDRLSDQFAKDNSLVPDSLTDLERVLNYQITSQNELLFNMQQKENQNTDEIAKVDSLLFLLKKQRDELNQYLENNYGEYYEMKYANSMLSIEDVRRNLKSNEVVIEYILNETDSIPEVYAFFSSSDKSDLFKLNTDTTFIHSLEETFRFISNPSYLFTRNESSLKYCSSAHYLYNVLLQPFKELIGDKKITIIPDGKLSYLPFDALLTEMPDTSGLVQFNNLPYVIRDHTINYSYSANLLFKFKRQSKKAKNRLIAFAPDYNTDTISFENERLILIPLPGIQREVELIANTVKTNLYRGKEASEKNFREQSGNHDILHLAMHAFINDSLPAFSRFAFAQNQGTLPENDGWLNTADIYNLDLNARLTVLSACNTGRGSLRKGEGVMSLARGFLYAGCPSIIMSMWEVEDNAGTKIMHSFYQKLKKGRSIDNALRQAKLKYLEEANPRLAHPHYWLGYVSIGSADPLYRSYDFYFFGLLILALAGITTDQIIQYRKSGKRRYKKEK